MLYKSETRRVERDRIGYVGYVKVCVRAATCT